MLSASLRTPLTHHHRNVTRLRGAALCRALSSSKGSLTSGVSSSDKVENKQDYYNHSKIGANVGHNFPDFIEWWSRDSFHKVAQGLTATTVFLAVGPFIWWDITATPVSYIPALIMGTLTAGFWHVGNKDMKQTSHAIRRNYPVLANMRYIMETIRPEIRQYLVESDDEGRPFNRMHRSQVYQRAKNVDDTIAFGTRRNVYETHHEWACHSMWPTKITDDAVKRHTIGSAAYGTTNPYSACIMNVSAMSYGAISGNAILALNQGAKMGNFYQNTGEGGVSRFHLQGGGDIVWNIGTGYFGCGSGSGENRVFEPTIFRDMIAESEGRIRMIEIKLSQGAKPGHGGLLPKAKITREIAESRKLPFPPEGDCHSPIRHSAFSNAHELVEFIARVRQESGGLPVGIKLCVGEPRDIARLCKAMIEVGNGPDFITVDGAEGGTGAAPPEFANSVGLPLEEGLVAVRNLLVGAGLKDKTTINASGHIASGFGVVRNIALGADVTSAARAFMLSLGCIQALKCNTNKCPTGIATMNKDLMYGLDPAEKTVRVYNFHRRTVGAACDIIGAMGKTTFKEVSGNDIMRRVTPDRVLTLSEHFPNLESGCLLDGKGPARLQEIWDGCDKSPTSTSRRWIY